MTPLRARRPPASPSSRCSASSWSPPPRSGSCSCGLRPSRGSSATSSPAIRTLPESGRSTAATHRGRDRACAQPALPAAHQPAPPARGRRCPGLRGDEGGQRRPRRPVGDPRLPARPPGCDAWACARRRRAGRLRTVDGIRVPRVDRAALPSGVHDIRPADGPDARAPVAAPTGGRPHGARGADRNPASGGLPGRCPPRLHPRPGASWAKRRIGAEAVRPGSPRPRGRDRRHAGPVRRGEGVGARRATRRRGRPGPGRAGVVDTLESRGSRAGARSRGSGGLPVRTRSSPSLVAGR